MEVQAAGGLDPSGQEIQDLVSRGWTRLQLFDQQNQVQSGYWKVPFRILPVKPSLSSGQVNSVPQVGLILYKHSDPRGLVDGQVWCTGFSSLFFGPTIESQVHTYSTSHNSAYEWDWIHVTSLISFRWTTYSYADDITSNDIDYVIMLFHPVLLTQIKYSSSFSLIHLNVNCLSTLIYFCTAW